MYIKMRLTALVTLSVLLGLIVLEIEPTCGFRLQNGKSPLGKGDASKASNLKKNLDDDDEHHNEVSLAWPPSIPMWGFLPPPSSSNTMEESNKVNSASSKSSTKSDLKSYEEESPLSFLPSSSQHHHGRPEGSDTRGSPLSIEDPLPEDHEEEEEPWIANLKRSTGVSRASGGVKRTRNYDVPQIGEPRILSLSLNFPCPLGSGIELSVYKRSLLSRVRRKSKVAVSIWAAPATCLSKCQGPFT